MKDLLERVMPEFAPVPDRVDQVRRRMRTARDRRLTAGAAAAVLAVAAGAVVMAANRPPEEPAVGAASALCEQVKRTSNYFKMTSPFVPVAAAKVTMCIYEDMYSIRPSQVGEPGSAVPTGTPVVPPPYPGGKLLGTKVQQDADGVIGRKVNAIPEPGECARLDGDYRLVFEYENRAPVVVKLQDRCGQPIPRDELLAGGDVLGWLDRMGEPYLVLEPVEFK